MSLEGLSPVQLDHARSVIAVAKSYVLGELGQDQDHAYRAADIALAVCLVESNLLVYANRSVAGSLGLAHDAVGSDHASVGLFQQQVPGWGNVTRCQGVQSSAEHFYSRLFRLDWHNRTNGQLAQHVQGSAFPDRYAKRDDEAIRLRKALWAVSH
jgi:hypothetical protein